MAMSEAASSGGCAGRGRNLPGAFADSSPERDGFRGGTRRRAERFTRLLGLREPTPTALRYGARRVSARYVKRARMRRRKLGSAHRSPTNEFVPRRFAFDGSMAP